MSSHEGFFVVVVWHWRVEHKVSLLNCNITSGNLCKDERIKKGDDYDETAVGIFV